MINKNEHLSFYIRDITDIFRSWHDCIFLQIFFLIIRITHNNCSLSYGRIQTLLPASVKYLNFSLGENDRHFGQFINARWAKGTHIFSKGLTFEGESRDHKTLAELKYFTLSWNNI